MPIMSVGESMFVDSLLRFCSLQCVLFFYLISPNTITNHLFPCSAPQAGSYQSHTVSATLGPAASPTCLLH